ncbi:uncharacterized protein LOC131995801 [Stomoxys calcitrans]|uniref:uncharacterized protein LOC131995801 n=1 Tax=Stomoxys calcitrans TaxID=35570 RepID=UPI0027E2C340|nr:uncharacterized protein LOC131995801 [Stomoxys calcitrans]
MMGNLPGDRVIRTRPFLNVGIDYLGPIEIHHKVRGKRIDKSYVCVFVCFATKAAHLEVASDLTSAAFIGALKRFVARRGCPTRIYCDNGTNFVGASNSLHEIYKLFAEKQHKEKIDEFCLQRDIEWINIPARSPHVGGLWEACVKSVKKHFHKAVEGIMTYEELCTLIAQIEAVLNSRPLTPLSEDPNDNSVLTPGHFLIGEAFTTIVDSSENKCYKGLRDHWRAVQENANAFWERWSMEYLSELNKRYKWNKPQSNMQPGTLVLLKEDNLPPLSWRRGRVIRTIIGSDGLCRMVDVRTSTGETKRSIQNVCPFPTENNEEIVGEDEATILNAAYNENKKPTICKRKGSVSPTLRRERIKNKNFIVCIINLLCLISPIRAKIDIIKFTEKSSIFFEEVSTVGLTKSSWDIVVHINISKYAASMTTINNAMSDYGVFVDKVLEKQQVFLRNELEEAYHQVQNRNELIMSSMPDRRSKRAALAFVGGIFHSLFGLMDEEHAEVLSEKIRNAAENQEYLLSLERNYTSIQDITSEVIKKQNEVIFDNIQKFKGSFDSLNARVNNLADREAIVRKATSLLATLEAFGEIQKNLITVMTNTKGSLLHELISVKKLKDEILRIRSTVNKRLRLPTERPMELSKLAHVTTRTTIGFILFNVRLPLINADLFTSYAIHAYPEMHDGLSVRIQPSNSYMLIDERKTMFYYISEENWAHCQKTEDMMICPQTHPLYNTRNTQSCEVQLFLKTRRVPTSCKVEIKAWANYWKQVQAPNTWIFSISTQMGAEAVCDNKRHAVIIEGQGLIKLQPNCHLETEETTLWAYDRYSSDADFMIPNINLTSFLPPLSHLKLDNEIAIYKLSDIPKATSILGWPTHLNIHHLAHYGFSVTTCIIIIVIIIAVIWILKKVCNMSSRYLPASIVLPRLR